MSHSTLRRRALALVGAGALLTTGLLSGLPAQAQGNIDPNQTRTLTIHKHVENGSAAVTPDGTSSPTGAALAGVTFTLYKVTQYTVDGGTATPLDLETDTASWTVLSNALGTDNNTNKVPTNACTTAATGSFTVGTTTFTVDAGTALTATGADGTTNTSPAIGAYLVCETGTPAEVVAPALPFVVTMPYVYNNAWLYDVHVYPKNGKLDTPAKTVDAQNGLGLGSTVSYTVTVKVPTLPAGTAALGHFVVRDTFDTKLAPNNPAVTSAKIGDVTFTSGPDYSIVVAGQEVRVEFTAAGLTKLNESHLGEEMTLVFQATVVGVGSIENTVEYSAAPGTDESFIPSTQPPVTNWGDVRILKIDGGNSAALAGAEFQVYAASDPYATTCGTTTTGDPIAVNGVTTFTSDANGVVLIPGLFVSSSNTADGTLAAARCYVLKETKAPTGYVASADIAVSVKTGATAETTYDATVENNKQLVPGLPLTGGEGTMAMTGGSLLLALLAAGAVVTSRRRNRA